MRPPQGSMRTTAYGRTSSVACRRRGAGRRAGLSAPRWRDQQVDGLEDLVAAFAVAVTNALRRGHLRVGDLEAALELPAHVLAVLVRALGEEPAMHVGDLAHEERILRTLGERQLDREGA